MSIHQELRLTQPTQDPVSHGAVLTTAAGRAVAVLRIATAFLFLWAFLDKTFGLDYSTTSPNAWIHGGSPTRGFLSTVHVGPMAATLRSWAGAPWADWLFMIGLAGIGLAVLLGVALRISAVAGTLMMALMWIAEWPLAKANEAGQATHSTNPIVDYHFMYALVLIVLAFVFAGNTWGLGRRWAGLVRGNPWLL